ncbi:MAG: hypothetical protein QOD02_577 [Mycobacterium sp.]|nr:hypothetical protein [Mycobacterium sp.]MDT5276831.1 hypothetical protein [Mycobacterium sp.]MDT7739250.1 hypothetical protein [Mycobacterium sp.]
MRALILAATVISALVGVAPASADPGSAGSSALSYPPPFVDHTQWAQWDRLRSLRVYPTRTGRAAARQLGSAGPEADEAWAEVLAQAPDAGTPGMHDQFLCHWEFAEVLQPGKGSWNLEPWRPVVDDPTMVSSGCNPGGGREPF